MEIAINNDEVVQKKRVAYANLGETIHRAEMTLQANIQLALKLLAVHPTKIEDINEAEAKLKEFISCRVQISAQRKVISGMFSPVLDRLINYEKQLTDPETAFKNELVELKKKHEEEEFKKQRLEAARKNLLLFIKNKLTEHDMTCRSLIAKKVGELYKEALETLDINPDNIAPFIEQAKTMLGVLDFNLEKPTPSSEVLLKEEVTKTINDNWNLNPHAYVTVFQEALEQKFFDYSVAYQNKVAALELAAKEEAENQKKLEDQKKDAEVANSLEANSTTLFPTSVGHPVKALKKSFAIDMPETSESAFKIIAHFIANKQKCMAKMKVQKWFSITPAQMAAQLARLKNEDNAMELEGIVFKEVESL